jgi:5-methylcytosine-specific restriction endonuclease McrA
MAEANRTCPVCDQVITGRVDRKTCSDECKREMKRAYDRAYAKMHSKRKTAAAIAWQRANPARKQAYDASYRERTREHRLELKRAYGKRKRDENDPVARLSDRLSSRKREALIASARFDVRPADVRRMRSRQRDECYYCSTPLGGLGEIEHVVPISRGGSHSVGNIVISCKGCNRTKAHRTVMEWRLKRVVPYRTAVQSLTVL